jgi:hypothetical protein
MPAHGLTALHKQRRLDSRYGGRAYTLLHVAKDQAGAHLWSCSAMTLDKRREAQSILSQVA